MANNYFSKQNPTDISLQSEDGGGLTLTKNGKFLFGAKLQEITDELNETSFNGVVDIDPNTNSSYIGIMNANSEPIDLNIPNDNQYSLFTPPEDNIVFTDPPKDDCANEFNDAATVLLTWENDNVNLGWDPYGANGTGIKNGEIDKAKKYFKDNFWDTNNKNTRDFSIASDALSNTGNPKLLIKNLPPGLRIMAAQFNYNAKQWWTRILAAVGEDWLGGGIGVPYRLTSNLGPNSNDSYEYLLKDGTTKSGKFVYNPYKVSPDSIKEFTLKGDKRIQLFIDQYDQIITLYNNDKTKFLTALKDETIRYYTALDGSNTTLLNFHKQYVEKAYNLALKYMDCPIDNQMSNTTVQSDPNKSTESTPPPSPTPPVSLTAAEIEEGIYEANFLPAVENEEFQIYDYIIYPNIVPTTYPPESLVTEGPLVSYKGPSSPSVVKGGKLVLNVGVLVGATGDVNQEIHLPHPRKLGKEIADRYRGLIPVKQVTFGDVISFADFITALKRVGLNETQARSCMAITGAESAKNLKKAIFTGYNFNIYGLQAEGKWGNDVSQYISYRYIAKDDMPNVNTGENKSLRIFAGFENIDNSIAAKTTAMNNKGFLNTTDKNDWAKKYRCTWVASGCDDNAALAKAAAIYDTWGINYFNKYKGNNY